MPLAESYPYYLADEARASTADLAVTDKFSGELPCCEETRWSAACGRR